MYWGRVSQGEQAFVFDDTGAYDAVSVVEKLIEDGFHVTLATRHGSVGAAVPTPEVTMAQARMRMGAAGVEQISLATLVEITREDVALRSAGGEVRRVTADAVGIVGYNELERDYADYFADAPFQLHVIGDAAGTHAISDSVSQAWEVARSI